MTMVISERLRMAVENLQFEHEGKELQVTARVGGVYGRMADCHEAIANDLITCADQQPDLSKNHGRNQCSVELSERSPRATHAAANTPVW